MKNNTNNAKDNLNIDFEDLNGVAGGINSFVPRRPDEIHVSSYNVVCFQCQGTIASNLTLQEACDTVESHRKIGHTPRIEEV